MKIQTSQEMVREILATGMTQQHLADLVQTSQPQIARVNAGQKTDYLLGKRIEAVYMLHANPRANTAA